MNFVKNVFNKVSNVRRNKGVTMLEMLLVLSIIAVLLVLATRYYMSTSYSQKVNQLQAQITAIQAAASNWKNGCPSLKGCPNKAPDLSITALSQAGYLATADVDTSAADYFVKTPWGDSNGISIKPVTDKAGYAVIEYTGDTKGGKDACSTVAGAIQTNIGDTRSSATCDIASGKFTYTFAP